MADSDNTDMELEDDVDDGSESQSGKEDSKDEENTKKVKGIIYLCNLPPSMTITMAREIFTHYGEVNRIHFEPAQTDSKSSSSTTTTSSPTKSTEPPKIEGWVEFEVRKIAKETAKTLNNKKIHENKGGKFYDYTWNMIYLPKLRWAHLIERIDAYERSVRKEKLRALEKREGYRPFNNNERYQNRGGNRGGGGGGGGGGRGYFDNRRNRPYYTNDRRFRPWNRQRGGGGGGGGGGGYNNRPTWNNNRQQRVYSPPWK